MIPTKLDAWKKIDQYAQKLKEKQLSSLITPAHLDRFAKKFHHIYFDFSKHFFDEYLHNQFISLANDMNLKNAINSMFAGEMINKTEKRAVLHTALRQQNDTPVLVSGQNIIPLIKETDKKIEKFVNTVLSGQWQGVTGKPIKNIVNIGIGGSDLGPKMVLKALDDFRTSLNSYFISNIDPFELDKLLEDIDLETTLFLVVSKSFSTQETLTNAKAVQQLYIEKFGKNSIAQHFVTVSTQVQKAMEFGIHPNNIFPMWNWVGGRYSLWSPAGISIALSVGYQHYEDLKKGAYLMDLHFKNTPLKDNIPALGAFISMMYNNFFGYETEAYLPYADKLKYFPDFLQQLIMESNGKSVSLNNEKVSWQTGNIIWGNIGTNAQHSFFQLLHQGTKKVPVTFIAEKENGTTRFPEHHFILLANMLAQSEALMKGEKNEVLYKNFEGNRPSSIILMDKITPEILGSLIAYFEHKTFVEAWLWQINAFDQFGVELGKKLAKQVLQDLINDNKKSAHDLSTQRLIEQIKLKNRS